MRHVPETVVAKEVIPDRSDEACLVPTHCLAKYLSIRIHSAAAPGAEPRSNLGVWLLHDEVEEAALVVAGRSPTRYHRHVGARPRAIPQRVKTGIRPRCAPGYRSVDLV
jgi:hypothetical protein